MPSSTATSSAVSPRVMVALPPSRSFIFGLTRRQPSVVSATSAAAAHGRGLLGRTIGARVIDSTPPATTTSASPLRICWAAEATACRLLAHRRLTV